MRRWQLAMIGVAALAVAACEQKKEAPAARVEETPQPLTQIDSAPPPETDPYATDTMVTPSGTVDKSAAGRASKAGTPAGGRTHVVQKGDTFSKLARQYYNDAGKWKKIWEANRNRVPDPNKLEIGTKLVIP